MPFTVLKPYIALHIPDYKHHRELFNIYHMKYEPTSLRYFAQSSVVLSLCTLLSYTWTQYILVYNIYRAVSIIVFTLLNVSHSCKVPNLRPHDWLGMPYCVVNFCIMQYCSSVKPVYKETLNKGLFSWTAALEEKQPNFHFVCHSAQQVF